MSKMAFRRPGMPDPLVKDDKTEKTDDSDSTGSSDGTERPDEDSSVQ